MFVGLKAGYDMGFTLAIRKMEAFHEFSGGLVTFLVVVYWG